MAVPSGARLLATAAQIDGLQANVPTVVAARDEAVAARDAASGSASAASGSASAAQGSRVGAEAARDAAVLAASDVVAHGQIHFDAGLGRYSNDSLQGFFAARSTLDIYGVEVPSSLEVECVKTGANAGVPAPVPSTDSDTGSDPYVGRSAFTYIEVNGGVDDDGTPFVTAIEGDDRFARDGSNGNVWIMAPVLFWRFVEGDGASVLEVSDTHLKGFEAQPKAYLPSGELRPYMLYAKYQLGEGAGGEPLSVSGVEPKAELSHNTLRTFTKAASTGYSGKSYADDWYVKVMFLLKYATKNSQSVYRQVSAASAAVMTGLCDHLVGDGSPAPQSGGDPFVMQGIEMALGLRDILGDVIIDIPEICTVLDSQKSSTSVTANYTRTGKMLPQVDPAAWNYTVFVDNAGGLLFGAGSDASSSTGMCDGTYMNVPGTSGLREWLGLGSWSYGAYAGLWLLHGTNTLSSANAHIGSRLSAVGRGGEAA